MLANTYTYLAIYFSKHCVKIAIFELRKIYPLYRQLRNDIVVYSTNGKSQYT